MFILIESFILSRCKSISYPLFEEPAIHTSMEDAQKDMYNRINLECYNVVRQDEDTSDYEYMLLDKRDGFIQGEYSDCYGWVKRDGFVVSYEIFEL